MSGTQDGEQRWQEDVRAALEGYVGAQSNDMKREIADHLLLLIHDAIRAPAAQADQFRRERSQLAEALLSLADDAGMPDSYKQTDSRVALAREVLDAEGQNR